MQVAIRQAQVSDVGAIFTVQRAAFVDEARLYETPFVPALDETLEDLTSRLSESTSWVATVDERIVGAVSLRSYRDGGPDIERLMVAPDMRGTGIASRLLAAAEEHAIERGHRMLQLIVGDIATNNRAMYRQLGWVEASEHRLAGFENVVLHTMTKPLS